jgi:hypothetical protein
MTFRSLLAVLVVSGLSFAGCLAASHPARAQDDDGSSFDDFLAEIEKDKQDEKRCQGSGGVSQADQRAACTRIIENAPYENDLVGTYYVHRATTYQDIDAQCADVTKGVEIIEREKSKIFGKSFLDAARRLQDSACR